MLRSFFGLQKNPFDTAEPTLLTHQQEVFDILLVHCQQGGLCLVCGEPGTGKSIVRKALQIHDTKRLHTPHITRTLHDYQTLLKLLCESFQCDYDGGSFKCERALVQRAFHLHRQGHCIAVLIDDAHLIPIGILRKLRLLFDDFPHSHNLILFSQTELLNALRLHPNHDILSRLTYSARLHRLPPETIEHFLLLQLEKCALPKNTFDPESLALIARAADGILRHAKNLALSSLLIAASSQQKQVSLPTVNKALLQPHWRKSEEIHVT